MALRREENQASKQVVAGLAVDETWSGLSGMAAAFAGIHSI
jgi:hypothetical protein